MLKSVFILAGIIIVVSFSYFYFAEKKLTFPYSQSGVFIQEPTLAKGSAINIKWTIPDHCQFNEMLYRDRETKDWGGLSASCQSVEKNTSQCSVNVDGVFRFDKQYDIQANSRECTTKKNFISNVVPLRGEL